MTDVTNAHGTIEIIELLYCEYETNVHSDSHVVILNDTDTIGLNASQVPNCRLSVSIPTVHVSIMKEITSNSRCIYSDKLSLVTVRSNQSNLTG